MVKNLPTIQETQETWVASLGWEDPLKEGMATHSTMLAWRIPWTGKPGRLQSIGLQRVGPTEVTQHTRMQEMLARDSVAIQWLRIHPPMPETQVQSLSQEDPTGCRAATPMHHHF